jgi:hypothetical protein
MVTAWRWLLAAAVVPLVVAGPYHDGFAFFRSVTANPALCAAHIPTAPLAAWP